MTRLVSEWIVKMEENAANWSNELKEKTGMDYLDIAAVSSGKLRTALEGNAKGKRVAVIPVTSGLGAIDSFAQSVAAIVNAMGIEAFVTECTDVNGVYEAYTKGADILMMADDDRYIALNRISGELSDNNIATASGYSEMLMAMAGKSEGFNGQTVVVLGYGIIGKLMASYLKGKGAVVFIYDKNLKKREDAEASGFGWVWEKNDLKKFQYIADATSEGKWIDCNDLSEDAVIVAPGIPFSLTDDAKRKFQGRYVHDLLEIGTACMIGGVL